MTGDSPRYAKVPAELSRGSWHRDASHVATAGQVSGRGTSQAAALADLGSQLTAMASRVHAEPSLWWDAANSQLFIAVADPVSGGHFSYIARMTPEGPVLSSCSSSGSAPVSEAYSTAVGMTRVTREGYRAR